MVVATYRNTLISVVKVVVIVGKAKRKPFYNKGRKLVTGALPLLFCIALNKLFVNVPANQGKRLLLKVFRLGYIKLLNLLLYFCPCLAWGFNAPHFRKGIHIKGQIIKLVLINSHRRVYIVIKLGKLIYILPNSLVRGVENVSAVLMHIYVLNFLAVNISACVAPFVNHKTAFATLFCLVGKNTTKKSCTDN